MPGGPEPGRRAFLPHVWEVLLDLIYPPKCPFCGRVLDSFESGMCSRCTGVLPWIGEAEKEMHIEFCDRHIAPFRYRDGVVNGIHRYKFNGGRAHAALFSRLMARCVAQRLAEPVDLITWVPLSRERLKERRYDQARLLAEGMAAELSVPAVPTMEKLRNTKTQSRLTDDAQRRANVRGVYRPLPDALPPGARVLLVDDVATSGATLSECAACLRLAGAGSVIAVTLARAGK